MYRKFEIPYNFDINLINEFIKYKKNIDFFYIPPFKEDMIDARIGITSATNRYPKTRKDYEAHIQEFQNNNIPFTVLLQDPFKEASTDIIKYYIDLGTKNFIVNKDETATKIKNIDKNINITASITKKINFETIIENQNKYKELYKSIVLFYPFNRSLNKLKLLPITLNYTFLLNDSCNYLCPEFYNHWFHLPTFNQGNCKAEGLNKSTIIPEALPFFDKYAYSYKLQGRDKETSIILSDFLEYHNMGYYDLENSEEKKEYMNKYKRIMFLYNDKQNGNFTQEENIYQHYNNACNYI